MQQDEQAPLDGGCSCRQVRFRLLSGPLFVHCCHCTWCQRESGSAFHISTSTRQPWVVLPPGLPAVPEYYQASEHWPAASLERRDVLRAQQQ